LLPTPERLGGAVDEPLQGACQAIGLAVRHPAGLGEGVEVTLVEEYLQRSD
jgi:hypothetical protein